MDVELSQHKNILTRMEHMLVQLKVNEHNIAVCSQVDTFWYLQKIEELRFMQIQVEEALTRYKELRLKLHTESHKAYHRMKADNRLLRKLKKQNVNAQVEYE